MDRREFLRASAAGGLAAALAAGCRDRDAVAAERIAGSIVDREFERGHLVRGPLVGGPLVGGPLVGGPLVGGGVPAPDAAGATRDATARVLVVGGGVAGLSAAWRLARAGVDGVVVLELADELGGTSRGGRLGGLAHPWAAHYVPVPRAEQRALSAFLVDAGLARAADTGRLAVDETQLVRAPDERLFTFGVWEEGLWPRGGGGDEAQLARFEALVESLAGLALPVNAPRPFDLPLARTSAAQRGLDAESAGSFAARHGLVGERMRWWLEYATRDDFGARLEDTSAYALVHYFAGRLEAPPRGAGHDATTGAYMTWPEGNARLVAELARLGRAELHRGSVALSVSAGSPGDRHATVEALDVASGARTTWRAEHVVLATPQYVNRHLLREDPARAARATFRYGPWVVANLLLAEPPPEAGFPRAWDNVRFASPSLGYVDATHQLDRTERATVWTWYLPVTDTDERAARAAVLAAPWEHWRDLVLADLRGPHSDIAARIERIDVRRFGHGMVRPIPGWLWGGQRERAAASFGRAHFAHTDLSGMALFEEAQWHGTRAAEEILVALGLDSEPLA